jgi:ketosteroid isomerase-like protein
MEGSTFWRDTAWAMSQENIETLRRGYETFNRGNASELVEFARENGAPDMEWGATGEFPGVEGVYRGPDAIRDWMDIIRSEWKEFEVSLDEVLLDGGDVLVVAERLRGRGRESGAEVEMRIFSAYWFAEGKLSKRAAFTQPEEALEAAGLSE